MALDVLASLYENLLQTEVPNSKKSMASISAIFRIIPAIPHIHSQSPAAKKLFIDKFFDSNHLLAGKLQLFFIKRSFNPRDIHSGQVAFPGGRKEKNETSFETAIRETYEEVGISLNTNDFCYLGGTKEINVYKNTSIKELMVCTHGNE